ncbi:MAG: hypothetical protein JO047_12640, partial [Alphaproteobacteria bacterium]|nr:hypothetical protein [Alphaproteobacteria bacterium]
SARRLQADSLDTERFRARWAPVIARDPHYNRHLRRDSAAYEPPPANPVAVPVSAADTPLDNPASAGFDAAESHETGSPRSAIGDARVPAAPVADTTVGAEFEVRLLSRGRRKPPSRAPRQPRAARQAV